MDNDKPSLSFTHSLTNPNDLIIAKDDFHCVPFGNSCSSALACKYAGIRNASLPLDWAARTTPRKIQEVLESDFSDFIPDVHNNIFVNKYDLSLPHFNPILDDGIKETGRRIRRLLDILRSTTKIYFVYVNDAYLVNDNYRQSHYTDTFFREMVDLELFLKKRFLSINFSILFFDFTNHSLPEGSNIVEFVIRPSQLYDSDSMFAAEALRKYIGHTLADLFDARFKSGFSVDDFYV
jgi:hypothetical protein